MLYTIGLIVVAAGHGTLRPDVSKLAEPVNVGRVRSMAGTVLQSAVQVPGIGIALLVLNERFRPQLEPVLREEVRWDGMLRTVIQRERRGAADAVAVAMRYGTEPPADGYLVVYGDMPLWRPETLAALVALHRRERPAISMVTVRINGAATPRILERYGRVFRDAQGRIVNVVEPGDARPEDLAATTTVNPSLYVFDRAWFLAHVDRIPPYPRADGHGDELHLPPLLAIAAKEEAPVAELVLDDPEEALGVNTVQELADVRAIIARRSGGALATAAE